MDFSFSELFGGFAISTEMIYKLIKVGIVIVLAYIVAKIVLYVVKKALLIRLDKHESQIIGKVVYYGILIFGLFIVLNILEVQLSGILATAGVLTIAISFAAQTTLSNLISSIFLYIDKPFEIGDTIEIRGKDGVVLSIGILSTKLRTFDNLYYRVPNSILIEEPLTNYTMFDIRRMEITIRISYTQDLELVKELLLEILNDNPYILKNPAPAVYYNDFASSSVDMTVQGWIKKGDILDANSDLRLDIKNAFDEKGVDIPFEQLVVHFDKSE